MSGTGVDTLRAAAAFVRARFGQGFASRDALLAWQRRRVRAFLAGPLRAVAYYRGFTGDDPTQLPVVDKATMLHEFAGFQSTGLTFEEILAVALRSERERDFAPMLPGGVTVGLSSGTSGKRGVFLVSQRERALWAGTILARTLPRQLVRRLLTPWARPLRVAFFLRANSNLYTAVRGRRIEFRYFDLLQPLAEHVATLRAFDPDVLVAPASVLAALAASVRRGEAKLRPARILSVAEVLEPDDEEHVAAAFGVRPGQVYQCTEGLLATSCEEGALHLHEESVHFEPEWLDAERTRFVPRITDFTRTTQVFARYRLDDVLRVDPRPCACGRVTLRIAAIEGRQDDVLWFARRDGGDPAPLFPDVLRRAMALAQGAFDEYRIEGHATSLVVRIVPRGDRADAERAIAAEVQQACARAGLVTPRIEFRPWEAEAPGVKRRRIRRATSAPREGEA